MPRLQVKSPRNVLSWSLNNPPQALCLPMTEPSVLTFSQGGEGAFYNTITISLTLWLWGETENESRKLKSEVKQLPVEELPLIATKECVRTLAAWIVTFLIEKCNVLRDNQIVCRVCTTTTINMLETWEELRSGIQERRERTVERSNTQLSLPPSQYQSSTTMGHHRNKCSNGSSDFKQKEQIETITQPKFRRFSSVGILPCISRQKIKEWEGGILEFQRRSAQGSNTLTNLRKDNACLAVNLPSTD